CAAKGLICVCPMANALCCVLTSAPNLHHAILSHAQSTMKLSAWVFGMSGWILPIRMKALLENIFLRFMPACWNWVLISPKICCHWYLQPITPVVALWSMNIARLISQVYMQLGKPLILVCTVLTEWPVTHF